MFSALYKTPYLHKKNLILSFANIYLSTRNLPISYEKSKVLKLSFERNFNFSVKASVFISSKKVHIIIESGEFECTCL